MSPRPPHHDTRAAEEAAVATLASLPRPLLFYALGRLGIETPPTGRAVGRAVTVDVPGAGAIGPRITRREEMGRAVYAAHDRDRVVARLDVDQAYDTPDTSAYFAATLSRLSRLARQAPAVAEPRAPDDFAVIRRRGGLALLGSAADPTTGRRMARRPRRPGPTGPT